MHVLHHRRLRVSHAGPALQDRVVLVGQRPHHSPDIESLLAVGVGRRAEDLADGREVRVRMSVRELGDVAIDGVVRADTPRRRFAGGDIGVVVVSHEDVAGGGQVRCPVLGLPVGSHDPVVATDAEVVLSRDAAGEVQRLLAGEHHRRVRSHDQNTTRVHQHRGFGVPIGLRADVDAVHDNVDLAAILRELHNPLQRSRDPVHILRTGVHGDASAGGQRVPLDRNLHLLSEIQSGDHPAALRLGQRAQRTSSDRPTAIPASPPADGAVSPCSPHRPPSPRCCAPEDGPPGPGSRRRRGRIRRSPPATAPTRTDTPTPDPRARSTFSR